MNAKHTPGPWQVNATSTRVSSAQYDTVANIAVNHVSEEARRVNAALIAAAPELLDALCELVAEFDVVNDERDSTGLATLRDTGGIVLARAAIAKATGA